MATQVPGDLGRRRASLGLMAASGFAGPGYQIVWTQQCSTWLGHEAPAVLAVVAAFFGGMALGAFAAGPRIERSSHPVRWYAACELIIALWGLALVPLMAPAGNGLLVITGVQPAPWWQWTVAFGGTFFLLLPATAAMGATLPAMERVTARMRAEGRSIAAHYASNTLGAVVGVLAAAFWMVPQFGLAGTARICIALNLLCAASALIVLPRDSPPQPLARLPASPACGAALARLAFAGLLGIGFEVLVVRVLSQVAEDTVYTFALLLSVLRVSPEFRPAYDPLLHMAAALSPTDLPAARALLRELATAQPDRPEAALLAGRLDAESSADRSGP